LTPGCCGWQHGWIGIDADDLAELADDHELAGLVRRVHAGDLAHPGVAFMLMTPLPAAGLDASLVDVGALATAVLPDRENEAEPNSQNGNPSKINPEKVACFSSSKTARQLPSFHQQFTTTSPPKNHVQPSRFCQNPQQKQGPATAKKIPAKAPLFGQVLRFSGDDYGGDHFVLGPSRKPWRCPIDANSPPTENGPAMSQNPRQRSFSGEDSFA
jgi:hypothetical protein